MMTTSEKATQKSMTFPSLCVQHTRFLWALCQALVRSTTQGLWPEAERACPSRRP
jgi:hypothetical protein